MTERDELTVCGVRILWHAEGYYYELTSPSGVEIGAPVYQDKKEALKRGTLILLKTLASEERTQTKGQ